MNKISSLLLIAGSSISMAHALDAVPAAVTTEPQETKLSTEKPAIATAATSTVVSGKSREQVIAELMQAIKDGTHVAESEMPPEQFLYRPLK